ncbi:MAG: TetR/AcrR family transcriptional regulator [Marinifilaceae bacterium]
MQVKKEEVRREILRIAKNEFIEKEFKGTSMRDIAKKAGVSLSNIYNYFRNKDEIYVQILTPLLQAIDKTMEEHNGDENITTDIFLSEEYQKQQIHLFTQLIEEYRVEFRMLLCHSHGSSLQNYRERFTDAQTRMGVEYFQKLKEKYPQIHTDISEFFLHTTSSWFLTSVGEIVTHELSHDEIVSFVAEYVAFCTAGWKRLLKV